MNPRLRRLVVKAFLSCSGVLTGGPLARSPRGLCVHATMIPTGELRARRGTPFDLRARDRARRADRRDRALVRAVHRPLLGFGTGLPTV